MNRLLCGGAARLGVKASSVSVSMCALYSSVCVYASVSYGCFSLAEGVGAPST